MDFEKYDDLLKKFGIETVFQKAAFYAQVHHESQGFTKFSENLNYSAARLLEVWPKRFNAKNVNLYAHNPEKLANFVYANRLGNGSENSGDGWKFRGAGFIQLTGKENHSAFAQYMGVSLEKVPGYLRTEQGATVSACWFWKTHNLNVYVDKDDFAALTRRINGGLTGFKERKELYDLYLKKFGACK